MKQADDRVRGEPALIPEGVFVIQLRSDSAFPRRRLRGRVEHVMSGQSAPFTSLATLLAFMARHAATGMAPTPNAKKKGDSDEAK
jgi:hypothetical protein